MTNLSYILFIFLIICAVAVSMTKNLLTSIVMYMTFSLVMCVVWIVLESPDLALTEAAVGAGITSLLLFLTLKKIHTIDMYHEMHAREDQQDGGAQHEK